MPQEKATDTPMEPEYHLVNLNRNAYIDSITTIADPRTLKFANMSLDWWDKHFSWEVQGCVALCDSENMHLCYIFYKIDRYRMYLTIHNIFTPLCERRKGYAHELLKMVFDIAILGHVSRFKITSISNSLDFYLALGFVYWGVNSVGDYYCDLPIPIHGLDTLNNMVSSSDDFTLIGKSIEAINKKVHGYNFTLTAAQQPIYDSDKIKMGSRYMSENLLRMNSCIN
ncbi:MAG: hypothetical protein WC667_12375 [Sulfurimonas sp.]|jgi:hypothetical protein